MKNKLQSTIIILAVLMIAAGIGAPKNSKKIKKRTDSRVLARILQVCPPLPDSAGFSIPGYKSVQCFYRVKPNGSLELVEDLNQQVSIPKPVE